jgi:hypothetical protein
VTTDAQGRFSFTKVFASTTSVTAEYMGRIYGDAYVADVQASVGAHVRHPISFSDNFTVRRYDRSRPTIWRAQGYVMDPNDQDRVQIQVAPSPTGPWATVASAGYSEQFSFGVEFKCDVELFGPGYVRAYSPTTLDTNEAVSKTVFVMGASAPQREPVVGRAPVPRRG